MKLVKIMCGTDIIEISRIKDSIENIGEKFIEKIYSPKEIEYCESKGRQKYQHYAVRFAAKEAIFKAISRELTDKYEIAWNEYEVLNDENGRPYVNMLGKNREYFKDIDISLSHCKEYAIANVVLLGMEEV